MAQSKNNRKKGRKKNNKSHAAQTTKNTVPRMRNWDKEKKIRFACLGIMIVGFVLALIDNRITALIGIRLRLSARRHPWSTPSGTPPIIRLPKLCCACSVCCARCSSCCSLWETGENARKRKKIRSAFSALLLGELAFAKQMTERASTQTGLAFAEPNSYY